MKYNSLILYLVGHLLVRSHSTSVNKRSDDSNPLTAVVQGLATDVTELKAQLDAMNQRVGFSAQFSAVHTTVPKSTPFKFDQVIFNDGVAYDPMLGIFTAPFAGVYLFSLQFFTSGPQRAVLDIQVNGHPVHRMALDTTVMAPSGNGEDSDSMTVLLQLHQEDRVWVETYDDPHTFWGSFHTFFNGHLVYAS